MNRNINTLTPLLFNQGYFMLPVQIKDLPAAVAVKGEQFIKKEEFHISILAAQKYAHLYAKKENIPETEAEEKITGIVDSFLKKYKLVVRSVSDDLRLTEENDKKTIIVMCQVDGVEELFQVLREKLEIAIPTPPTHITLYTLKNGKSIGILNEEDLKNLTQPLLDGKLQTIKEKFI